MHTIERQVGPNLSQIRADHIARYQWASRHIDARSNVLDCGAGIGYGMKIMAGAGHRVLGLELSDEAREYWHEYYRAPGTSIKRADLERGIHEQRHDAAIAFEVIEHLRDPKPLLKSIDAPRLLASVPNEVAQPWSESNKRFHHRHYTKAQFSNLLVMCGWRPMRWWHQAGQYSAVEPMALPEMTDDDEMGITLIAECERWTPEFHIAVLGLGPSLEAYVDIVKRLGNRRKFSHLTWGINAVADVIQCDALWHMDDYRIQQIRAAAQPDSNIAAMLAFLKRYRGTIYTSRSHPDLFNAVEFPLEDVMNHFGYDYFNSTGAYAIAYALHIGVTKLSLFGFDFTYPDAHKAEKGRACVEFWLGQAAARGVKIAMPKTTSLMDALHTQQERLYGYDTWSVKMDKIGERITVEKTECGNLPTAEEIEAAYDHGMHPNPLMN